MTPSYVAFSDTERLIGDATKDSLILPDTFVFSVFDTKRLNGCKLSDAEVQSDINHFPFKVINKGRKPYIQVQYRGETKEFSPEEVNGRLPRTWALSSVSSMSLPLPLLPIVSTRR
jgi:molecular chaperone DnaK (HSP70)